ncbi:MFS general substrate transporter [Mycena metata]|uniref:MFS general substrate transporter n=1 Tax=Mycena metata TaxID=1033252 RepID=A0AAD7NZ33_9AGAR|nr:MFS general substrate transporter [Mycena metata]
MSDKNEKGSVDVQVHDEKVESRSTIDSVDGDEALRLVGTARTTQFSEEYNRKLRRKLDLLIPPLAAAVYFTQFLDKTSLNYASIMGLPITGQNYNLVSAAFYFGDIVTHIFAIFTIYTILGFLLFEFPTVYISQKLRVAKYLGVNIIIWGIILMLHAVGTSFGAFFALRFLLGMCECCVAPILILIISMFYKKNEQASRISWFYVMNGLTQIFGGFVAYGISFYTGTRLAPFKIIYILLGGLAIVVGIAVLIWMPDSPVHANFLTREERIAAIERVRDDQGGTENKKLKKGQIAEAFLDVRTWLIILTTLLKFRIHVRSNTSSFFVANFLAPSSKQTLILSTPAGAIAAGTTLLCGWYSDKKGERMLPIIFALVPTIVGTAMLIGLNNTSEKGALLFGVYLVGTFGSALSTVYAYNASNTAGHTKKSTINAATLVSFAVGNIIGTQIFQPKDAPGYVPGKIAIMVLLTVQLGISWLLRWINLRLNIKKRAKLAEIKAQNGWTDEDVQREREKHAFADLT